MAVIRTSRRGTAPLGDLIEKCLALRMPRASRELGGKLAELLAKTTPATIRFPEPVKLDFAAYNFGLAVLVVNAPLELRGFELSSEGEVIPLISVGGRDTEWLTRNLRFYTHTYPSTTSMLALLTQQPLAETILKGRYRVEGPEPQLLSRFVEETLILALTARATGLQSSSSADHLFYVSRLPEKDVYLRLVYLATLLASDSVELTFFTRDKVITSLPVKLGSFIPRSFQNILARAFRWNIDTEKRLAAYSVKLQKAAAALDAWFR